MRRLISIALIPRRAAFAWRYGLRDWRWVLDVNYKR